ncbi:hypothetical protein [Acinetobacter sp.]|uniref:hypothetical protein n=1 Tax=Acinetobacter sp. TaxID=472 RepID=UPI000C0B727D|nr:hypothetical protein [Acinetobacter sp.]MAK29174.1 hypothetical protein [Acinetobacter sp.]
MKKTILFSLLIAISYNLQAEEVKAKITYTIKDNRILSIIVNSKDEIKRQKCEDLVMSKEARELFKKKYEHSNEKYAVFYFICED